MQDSMKVVKRSYTNEVILESTLTATLCPPSHNNLKLGRDPCWHWAWGKRPDCLSFPNFLLTIFT